LIELIIVIVVLGVLAAVAIPNYIDLKSDAQQSVANGVAGALAAACSNNYAIRSGNPSSATYAKTKKVAACADAWTLLQDNSAASGYTMTGDVYTSAAPKTCTITSTSNSSITASFTCPSIS
jgi:MSHA pilin protein MshA